MKRFAWLTLSLALVGCAGSARAPAPAPSAPRPADPRVGLRAGWMDAAEAASGLRVVSRTPPSAGFMDRDDPGDYTFMNSDLAFTGRYAIQGNFHGFQIWDISTPAQPTLVTAYPCPGAQNDVSVYDKLLFVSVEAPNGRVDCGTQGVADTVSAERMRGIRIFDISNPARPKPVANVQTCRGSHTHTLVTDPRDTANVYIYVSGSAPVRSPNELAGCSGAPPDEFPNTALFRIEVIQVPLAAPQRARIVSSPRILAGLTKPTTHGAAPQDVAAAAGAAAAARAAGKFTATVEGMEIVLPTNFVDALLDQVVAARGGSGAPTRADSATLRESVQRIVDRLAAGPVYPGGTRPGPTQCHDITVFPAIGLAAGACEGYGVLLDIRTVTQPRRIAAVADANFAYWHSATFNRDGSNVLFTDEWGGGLQARCRATDKREWGADALFTRRDSTLTFQSYYKLPVAQTAEENCVAHNGSLIPVPGRDIMVQSWYQGGISVFDWTDPAHPVEIAYFDRGPMDATEMVGGGTWSAYWYNGYIVSSEIARGLDVLELVPSAHLSRNEINAAKLARVPFLNVQHQDPVVWPPSFVVTRAYLDQLERTAGLAAERVAAARSGLSAAEALAGTARRDALTAVAAQLDHDAGKAANPAKVRLLAQAVRRLAAA